MHEVKHTSLQAAKDARMEEGTGKKNRSYEHAPKDN